MDTQTESRATPGIDRWGGGEAPLLLRAEEAARLLGLGRSTLFKMLASGELEPVRFGRAVRVRRADIEAIAARTAA